MKKVYRNKQGRVVGQYEDGVFRKSVTKSTHLFRKTNSWAIDNNALWDMKPSDQIQIFDKEEGILYATSVAEFKENCHYFQFGEEGKQAFLPLEYFIKAKPTEKPKARKTRKAKLQKVYRGL